MPVFACIPQLDRSFKKAILHHLRFPASQHRISTSVLKRSGGRRPETVGASSCLARHCIPSRASSSSLWGGERKAEGAARVFGTACLLDVFPTRGRGPPHPLRPAPPSQPLSSGLTPPEEPAETTHHDPCLSRPQTTFSPLPPCSR